jgi:autotransporter translocation and assembly factor TamB
MQRAIRWALGLVATIVVLLLVITGAVVVVMNTESGTRWAIDQVVERVPARLELGPHDGTLWRGLELDRLTYENEKFRVEADEVVVRVDWSTLVIRTLTLRRLNAGTIRYTRLSPGDSEATDKARLPFNIRVRQGRVTGFSYEQDDTTVTVENIAIVNFWTNGQDIRTASADAGTLNVTLDATNPSPVSISDIGIVDLFTNGQDLRAASVNATTSGVAINATNLDATIGPMFPVVAGIAWSYRDWSGRGDVRGALDALEFVQDIDGPYPLTAVGTAQLRGGDAPHVDATASWETWQLGEQQLADGEAAVRGWIDELAVDYKALLLAADQRFSLAGSARGSVEGFETFDLTVDSPIVTGVARGEARWLPELLVNADVDAEGEWDGRVLLADGKVRVAQGEVDCRNCRVRTGKNALRLDGRWTSAGVDVTYEFSVPKLDELVTGLDASASGSGNLSGGMSDLSGTLAAAAVRLPGDYEWTLQDGTGFRYRDKQLDIAAHGWSGSAGDVRINTLQVADDSIVVNGRVTRIPIALANAWLPREQIRLAGEGTADIDLRRQAGEWSGSLDWRQTDTVLVVTESTGDVINVRVPKATLNARLQGGVAFETEVEVEPGVTAKLQAEVSAPNADGILDARLDIAGDDWRWLPAIIPQIDNFAGSIRGTFTASGPLMSPGIAGDVRWKDGALVVPALNVPVRDIDVVVSGGAGGTADIAGTARAGDGKLTISGRIQELMRPERAMELTIKGDSATVMNWPEYKIWASPDLTLVGKASEWRVTGETDIPRAEIELREFPEGAVQVSEDIRVLDAVEPGAPPVRFTGEIALKLGDRVHIDALGLDAMLGGNLTVLLRGDRPVLAQGRIVIDEGLFESYGQKLTIRQGELTFTGPLEDPIVNVRAVRVIETFDKTVTAGLHLTGRASNLTTTVFSDPPMAEADALSYLVVGRPLNQATEAEGGDLTGAALALGVKQASRITEQIGQSFGLDQLSLTGDGGDTTALVAGKQVNDRLYARYAYGIFSRIGVLLLRYRLSDQFTLEAGAGDTESIDVMYTIER